MFLIACIKLLFITVITLLLALTGEIEKNIIYRPSGEIRPITVEFRDKVEMRSFTSPDNLELYYMHIKGDIESPKILFCHGNDTNITFNKVNSKLGFLADRGYEVFALDYRGYGRSQGSPDEQGVYSDTRAFVRYLGKKFGIEPQDIVIWGHSLGAAIAIDTALEFDFGGVIAEGGFTSIEAMKTYRSRHHSAIYDILEITQKFDSKEKIGSINSPILVLHGKKDIVIPYEMSIELANLNKNAELVLSGLGGHCDIGWQDGPILEFLRERRNGNDN